MKKILSILLGLMLFCQVSSVYAIDEFLTGKPAGTDNISLIDDYCEDNNIALVRLLADARKGLFLSYASDSTLTVGKGSVGCTNSAKTILRTRIKTSSTTVTWGDLDVPGEAASTTYYVYAVGDTDAAAFTIKLSTNSTAPGATTYYSRLGSFYNDSSSNITQIVNDNMAGTVPSGMIAMWSGLIANIPSGWSLCDGTSGTPDLRDKFIRGAGSGDEAGTTGGSDTNSGTHTYSGTTSTPSAIMNTGGDSAYAPAADDACTHTYSGTTSAPSDTNNMPAYYELLFIYKQ